MWLTVWAAQIEVEVLAHGTGHQVMAVVVVVVVVDVSDL